jgi:hypothetical protein
MITILMISFSTPNIVDAFIWIIPNLLSIFLRPYLIRYIHIRALSGRLKIYKELNIATVLLFLAGLGAMLVVKSL